MIQFFFFALNNTPLSRDGRKDLVQYFVLQLPALRQQRILFKNVRPENVFIQNFFSRHSVLSFKRRSNLDRSRQLAMLPENISRHLAQLHQVYQKYDIKSPEQVFNNDESGFSARTTDRSRGKALFEVKTRSDLVALEWLPM